MRIEMDQYSAKVRFWPRKVCPLMTQSGHCCPRRYPLQSRRLLRGVYMSEVRVDRRLAAIFAGDIAGYSRLMGTDEEGTLRQLKVHRKELVDPKITEHRGRIVKTTGDGMLVEFVSVVDAVRCAVDFSAAWPSATPKCRRTSASNSALVSMSATSLSMGMTSSVMASMWRRG
jgi:hypothetical protein